MKVLVLGDKIIDQYTFCKPIRLCPEACAPVLHIESERESPGGAALVAANLESLMGEESVVSRFGSLSRKHRIFAERTLLCRIDQDRVSTSAWNWWKEHPPCLTPPKFDAIVVSDYDKGAFGAGTAEAILKLGPPVFVDSKYDIERWRGAFCIFPNEHEHNGDSFKGFQHVVKKLGAKGCLVDGVPVPTAPQQVYDVSGAGDVFLAAFVYGYFKAYHSDEVHRLQYSAYLANLTAGISVRHLGTYVVSPSELSKEGS